MIAYEVVEHGRPLQAKLRETPRAMGRQVVVRITHSGLCHSDVHLWRGYFDLGDGEKASLSDRGIVPPLVLGHEPLGVVVDTGPLVEGVGIGDKRVVYPWLGCGDCWACEKGLTTLCVTPKAIGIARPGGFSTHLLVPDARYLVDSSGIDDAFAATLACSGITTYSAVNKVLPRTYEGDWIAVIGCGGLGLLAISILRALGFTRIVACDLDDEKLKAALEQGAAKTLRTDQQGADAELAAIAPGRLAGAIDFVGASSTFKIGYSALRRGGAYVLVGLHGGAVRLPLPPVVQRGVSILGSFVGTQDELVAVMDLARTGRLAPVPLTLRPPADLTEAIEALEAGRSIGRTVIDFRSPPTEP